MEIAIIIPVFNEADALHKNLTILDRCLKEDGLSVNYMLIDDGSADDTWKVIGKIRSEFKNVSGIRLSRNFGKESAMIAGIQNISADYYAVIDSDLQHPPQHVKLMLDILIDRKVNIVEGVKRIEEKKL